MAHPGDSCNSGAECLLSTVCCATGGELTCPLIAQLFNSGPAALLEVLPEPGLPIVQASASFSAMIGCNAEILVRDRVLFADLVESQDRQRVLAPLEELGKEGAAGSQVANDAPIGWSIVAVTPCGFATWVSRFRAFSPRLAV